LRSADVLHAGGIRGFVGVIAHIETAIVIETAIEREIVATPTGRACQIALYASALSPPL
jgi:hypothetical protein